MKNTFELEVPEIAGRYGGGEEIAREAGSRTKIAVASKRMVWILWVRRSASGGTRVMAVTNELGNEKIDIIEWSDDPAKFIGNSVSPAKGEARGNIGAARGSGLSLRRSS